MSPWISLALSLIACRLAAWSFWEVTGLRDTKLESLYDVQYLEESVKAQQYLIVVASTGDIAEEIVVGN